MIEEGLEGEKGSFYGENWSPVALEGIETDCALVWSALSLCSRAPLTYCLTADIRMEDLGGEAHLWRAKRVLRRHRDVYNESAPFVWSVWRSWKAASQLCDIGTRGLAVNPRRRITCNIRKLLRNTPCQHGRSHSGLLKCCSVVPEFS